MLRSKWHCDLSPKAPMDQIHCESPCCHLSRLHCDVFSMVRAFFQMQRYTNTWQVGPLLQLGLWIEHCALFLKLARRRISLPALTIFAHCKDTGQGLLSTCSPTGGYHKNFALALQWEYWSQIFWLSTASGQKLHYLSPHGFALLDPHKHGGYKNETQ